MSGEFEDNGLDLGMDVRREGDAAVVTLCGEVTVFSSPAVRDRLREVRQMGVRRMVLDLTGVTYVDSSGVATFVEALREMRGRGGEMVLTGISPRVRGVIEIARLDTLFPMAESVEEALEP
jgi:anti-sigma B factor antagonist